jgi:ubiquitin-like 1-activating enzyme E1 B
VQEAAERAAFFRRREGEGSSSFMARIYSRAYGADITRLLGITDMWDKPGRVRPTPLPPADASPAVTAMLDAATDADAAAAGGAATASARSACASLGLKDSHSAWSTEQAAAVFLLSGARLADRQEAEADVPIAFDKDDALAVEFVAAAAALRSANYGLPVQSLFVAKGMAGNIIHAIATTNAIISGLIVIEAIKLLRGGAATAASSLKCTWVQQFPNGRNALLVPVAPSAPAPGCYVCRHQRLHLALDMTAWTLGDVLDKVIFPKLGVTAPEVMAAGSYLYEHGDDLDEDDVAKYVRFRALPLAGLPLGGITDGSIVSVSDDTAGKFEVEMKFVHRDAAPGDAPYAFALEGNVPAAVVAAAADDGAGPSGAAGGEAAEVESKAPKAAATLATDADGCILLDDEEEPAAPAAAGGKRKRGAEGGGDEDAAAAAAAAKKGKGKAVVEDEIEVIEL